MFFETQKVGVFKGYYIAKTTSLNLGRKMLKSHIVGTVSL